jgi:hypothetical protein
MKKQKLLSIGVIALLMMLGWTVYAQTRVPTRTAWEYRHIVNPSDAQLSTLGADGWEMVGFTLDGQNSFLFFKRPR